MDVLQRNMSTYQSSFRHFFVKLNAEKSQNNILRVLKEMLLTKV